MRNSIAKKGEVEYFHFFVPVIRRISCLFISVECPASLLRGWITSPVTVDN